MIKKIIAAIAVRIDAILVLIATALIGVGVSMYSGRAAMIVVGSIILFDSFWDRIKRDKR